MRSEVLEIDADPGVRHQKTRVRKKVRAKSLVNGLKSGLCSPPPHSRTNLGAASASAVTTATGMLPEQIEEDGAQLGHAPERPVAVHAAGEERRARHERPEDLPAVLVSQ